MPEISLFFGLFDQVQLDKSRTCVYWNDEIDLPSHAIYEYGRVVDLQGITQYKQVQQQR